MYKMYILNFSDFENYHAVLYAIYETTLEDNDERL